MKNYKDLGVIYIQKYSSFMPVIEVKVFDFDKVKHFGVFEKKVSASESENQSIWNSHYVVDNQKIKRFLNIVIVTDNKENGVSNFI